MASGCKVLLNWIKVWCELLKSTKFLDLCSGLLKASCSSGFITLTFTEVFPSTIDVDIDEHVEHRRLVT